MYKKVLRESWFQLWQRWYFRIMVFCAVIGVTWCIIELILYGELRPNYKHDAYTVLAACAIDSIRALYVNRKGNNKHDFNNKSHHEGS